ncbi:RsmB/NOP family class I SAM-dependent RNA methyltransferase [Kordiimonas marina]|uniref:RsmB/NOP family class I SAM-dependent RNA methyltransferase n=1 Tax=Kordiimonas marina TaxID=2872312 RepID=UPI001FF1BC60|nr:transcription antitermination factor NusB [Kordiimonas marina]MCJ9429795.1 methyltransferase domain-containing protein [Kordiimonas marina]
MTGKPAAAKASAEKPRQVHSHSPREAAVRTLLAVTLKNRPFDAALDEITKQAGLDARDRAFVFNLVMLCLRRYGSLKALLGTLIDRGLPRNATWTEAALITGLAQILLMRTADHAATHETVDMIKTLSGKERGFAGLVNAILRRAIRERDALTATLDATPEKDLPGWLWKSWSAAYGAETTRLVAKSLQSEPSLDITVKDAAARVAWAEKLEATELPTGSLRRASTDVTALEGYESGDWWVQDMAAAIPATLLGDLTGKSVLDLCAAPGGKTLQLASLGAKVTAVDRSENRLKRLSANLARTGLKADIKVGDAARFKPAEPTDHILLDAPCSATGTLRRNPDLLWSKSPEDVAKLTALQARILDHAFSLLPVGGTLVYCVCSLEPGEGRDQIAAFLAHTKAAKRVAIGAAEVGDLAELITEEGDLLCLPSCLAESGGMDGFYAARLTRQE